MQSDADLKSWAGTLTKSVFDANWDVPAASGGESAMSFEAMRTNAKDLTPAQQYELVIAVRTCVDAIARNISGVHIRLLLTNGQEIIGGPLYDLIRTPTRFMTAKQFLYETASWYNIAGALGIHKSFDKDGTPYAMCPLDPTLLRTYEPARSWREVRKWQYTWKNGEAKEYSSSEIIYGKMFNPNSEIYGLSPLVTGSTEVATGYHLSRYNKSYFENNAIPSHILMLGEGVGSSQRKDIEARYQREFSSYAGNAHKVMVVAGKNAKIEQLDQPFQDGAFMELKKSVLQSVAMLYRVPAIEAGLYDKTRFDTAAEERKLFVESTLIPQCDFIGDVLQAQLIDPHHFAFRRTRESVVKDYQPFTKSMDARFEQAKYERPDSNIIIMLDTDTLPIMASVKAGMISTAKEFQATLQLSANETADYFKIDIPERTERDEIWVDRQKICMTNPKLNGEMIGAEMAAKQAINSTKPDASGSTEEPKPKAGKAYKTLLHKIRKLTMDSLDNGELFSLADADEIGGDKMKKAVRVIRHRLRGCLDADDPHEAAKEILNGIDPEDLN